LSVAFVASQGVIETSALPNWISTWGAHYAPGEALFQKTNPAPQLKVVGAADEKMNVIWHDDEAADGDIAVGVGSSGKAQERLVDGVGRE
jgi:hypothetical protein